ncbi:MAG: OB-fold nucleic acid binding domain-containing protein, partial [Planctomycetota bacterium]
EKLVTGMLERGYDEEFAERVFKQISGFGEYGFPESHAASFALLVYVSSWIKRYYPASFAAALINSQPMGFYAPAQLVRDAREHGVTILPADVNFSNWDCTLEPLEAQPSSGNRKPLATDTMSRATSPLPRGGEGQGEGAASKQRAANSHREHAHALRLGFRLLRGFSEEHARAIEKARARGPFQSLEEFARRTQLGRATLQILARADAFASLKIDRRDAFWKSLPSRDHLPLFDDPSVPTSEEESPELPVMTAQDEVIEDYSAAGLTLRKHPVSFLREQLTALRVVTAEQLAELTPDRRVKVAGLVLMRQRPSTASGITFVTLEDETGVANLVVYPSVWQQFRPTARFASVMLATGRLQREGDVIHVVCDRLDDVSEMLAQIESKARNFR